MNRLKLEKDYWNNAAKSSQVDRKYISDIDFDLPISPQGQVLEIGCGVGRLMKNGFYGIDISDEMIKIAKERKPKCFFKVSDGLTIPYKADTFNFVYSVLVFQHIPLETVKNYIKEASRVLKKGGILFFQFIEGTEDEPFSKHHSIDEIGKELALNKFFWSRKDGLIHSKWTWIKAEQQ